MKKIIVSLLMVTLIAISGVTAFATSNFTLNFEDQTLISGKTINFNATLSEGIVIGPQAGFTGSAFKAPISSVDGGIWWVFGINLDKAKNSEANFKGLKDITFKYKSTVAFPTSPFIIQLVWKNKADATEVTKIEQVFTCEKDAIKTVTVAIPADVKTKLDTKTGYYLDWVMVGLKSDAANNEFRTGSFIFDDLSFNKAPVAVATATKAPVGNPTTGDNSALYLMMFAIVSLSGITAVKVVKASRQN